MFEVGIGGGILSHLAISSQVLINGHLDPESWLRDAEPVVGGLLAVWPAEGSGLITEFKERIPPSLLHAILQIESPISF